MTKVTLKLRLIGNDLDEEEMIAVVRDAMYACDRRITNVDVRPDRGRGYAMMDNRMLAAMYALYKLGGVAPLSMLRRYLNLHIGPQSGVGGTAEGANLVPTGSNVFYNLSKRMKSRGVVIGDEVGQPVAYDEIAQSWCASSGRPTEYLAMTEEGVSELEASMTKLPETVRKALDAGVTAGISDTLHRTNPGLPTVRIAAAAEKPAREPRQPRKPRA